MMLTRTGFLARAGFRLFRPQLSPLPHGSLPWLMVVALLTALPHGFYQPLWLSCMVAGILCLTLWKWRRGYKSSPSWLKTLLILACLFGVWLEFQSFLSYEAGIALLILSVVMKLLELKSRRDAIVVVILSHFLLLAYYFYSQSLGAAFWLLVGPIVITAALIRLHDDPERPVRELLGFSGRLVLQALPFMVLLYLFFPRVTGPLWGLPHEGFIARTGFSELLDLGSIASLAQNDEIAFRVQFHGPLPAPDKLYWRGLVLDHYDGHAWRAGQPYGQPALDRLGNPIRYTLTQEAHNQRWLFPLDVTAQPPESEHLMARLTRYATSISRTPITSRKRMVFTSYLDYRLDPEASPAMRMENLHLPPSDPQTKALAQAWQAENPNPLWLARRALSFFRDEQFIYTLTPQVLGHNAIDDFLFVTRNGFCEHYASAFVVLMRAAGVPARIVTGYAGGEANPIDGHFVVRQSDAHAWAEIWLDGRGWLRIDPTSVIPPHRTESGATGQTRTASAPWIAYVRYRWEAMNNTWNQWVLGYTPDQQYRTLSSLGFQNADWTTLGIFLAGTFGLGVLALSAWVFRSRRVDDPARAIWREAKSRLTRQGIAVFPWETPLALARRLKTEAPQFYRAVFILARLVSEARYGTRPPQPDVLRAALSAVPRFARD
jgi:transglutaminase-like putative cysteine protease